MRGPRDTSQLSYQDSIMKYPLLSVTLLVFGVFFGLPLALGAYNETWAYLHDSSPSYTTLLTATAAEFLVIHLEPVLPTKIVRALQNLRPRLLSIVCT